MSNFNFVSNVYIYPNPVWSWLWRNFWLLWDSFRICSIFNIFNGMCEMVWEHFEVSIFNICPTSKLGAADLKAFHKDWVSLSDIWYLIHKKTKTSCLSVVSVPFSSLLLLMVKLFTKISILDAVRNTFVQFSTTYCICSSSLNFLPDLTKHIWTKLQLSSSSRTPFWTSMKLGV